MAGKIWEVPLSAYGRGWLIECELARHLRRRVLLAVDKSDSTAGAADSLESVTTELARTLDPGDTVALWVMGEAGQGLTPERAAAAWFSRCVPCRGRSAEAGCGKPGVESVPWRRSRNPVFATSPW